MELSHFKINSNQNSIANIFLEQLEVSLEQLSSIKLIMDAYFSDNDKKNFHLEIDLEMAKLIVKYLDTILSCFLDFKHEFMEIHKYKMLKLYDYMTYEIKRLRNKYEDMNEFYFSLDEENKFIRNIKSFIESDVEELKLTKIGCLYLRLLNHYLKKMYKRLKDFENKEYKILNEDKDKFSFFLNKIYFQSKDIFTYLVGGGEEKMIQSLNNFQTNEMIKFLMSEFNGLSFGPNDSHKWAIFFKHIIQSICLKIKSEKLGPKNILSTLKNGISSFLNILNSEKDNAIFLDTMPDINTIKLLFEAFESKLLTIPVQSEQEMLKTNEVLYLPNKKLENFKLIREKEAVKRSHLIKNMNRIRILTNQLVKINYEYQNLIEKDKEVNKMREINFFGLLLRVSKDFLTHNYNLVFHIPGGGFFSQSSESHLSYLSKWAKETDSVIISIDYKLTSENKYPVLLDECIMAYEMIVKFSAKLFNFNINKLVIYSDSVGSLIALDIIKHAIKTKIRKPDSAVFVCPCPNIVSDEMACLKESFSFFEDFLDIPVNIKIQEMFLDFNKEEEREKTFMQDDRLNFFLSDPLTIADFPNSLIVSSVNEPIRGDCQQLAHFLKTKNNKVVLKHIVCYCNGLFQIPFLFNSQYDKMFNTCLNYIQDVFAPKTKEIINYILDEDCTESKITDLKSTITASNSHN